MFQTKPAVLQNLARTFRFLAFAAAAGLAFPALAAPPANDDIANAVTITESLPFTHSQSTVEATVAPDPVLCYETGHTAWFAYTPTANGAITIDTFGSDYDTVLEAYSGLPEYGFFAGCNDDAGGGRQSLVGVSVFAGETIYFLVGSGNGSPGGNLVLNVNRVSVPVVTLSVIDPVVFNPANGTAKVRLRIESSAPVTVIAAWASLIQPNGRGDIAGTELSSVFQTGSWFEVTLPDFRNIGNDRAHGTGFKGGPARLIAAAGYYYGPDNSFVGNVQVDQQIRLKAAARQ